MRPLRLPRRLPSLLVATACWAWCPSGALGAQGAPPARPDSSRPRADTAGAATRPDSAKRLELFGNKTDLGIQFNGRFETKLEKTSNDRCVASQYFNPTRGCNGQFVFSPDFQFDVKTGGTVADRLHLNMDYDSRREFDDASNQISLWYEGKPQDRLQRIDVGNVSFAVPATRFISSGIPQGNRGVQVVTKFGALTVKAIAAEQTGNVSRDRVYAMGGRATGTTTRDIEDYQVEPRRFFFVVDPRRLAGYPNIDILDGSRLRSLAAALPDSTRPVKVSVYRLLIGGQPPNPNGPRFRIIGDPDSRRGQIYEVLRENVDYVMDPSQLWLMLQRPVNLANERVVVAYTVRVNGVETTIATTGGTPDVAYVPEREQFAALLWDPNVRPGDDAFVREIRSVYRVGGSEVRRASVKVGIVTGGTGEQEKPFGGAAATFLQLFGLSQGGNASTFDVDNRLWPRPGDPVASLGLSASSQVIADQFLVFPSLQPFARAGRAQPASNPSNDAIYVTPGEYLYSAQHPQSIYRIRLTYESDAGAEPGVLALVANQLRPFSERLTLDDGTALKRDRDYTIDYDLGQVTFLHPDSLFARPRNVTVRFEEKAVFAQVPTSIFGLASSLPLKYGELNFLAIAQRQRSTFTRPPLGYESQSAIIAGVNGQFAFDTPALTRWLAKLPGTNPRATSRLRVEAEVATSRPQPGGNGQAYLESFEGDGGIGSLSVNEIGWYLGSQPALGRKLAARIGGAATLDLARATTLAWQNNGLDPFQKPVSFYIEQIDPLTKIVGSSLGSPEPVLWMTLYPLGVGGAYNEAKGKYQWTVSGAPTGRRWRSIRQSFGAAGTDLSTVENLEFWALVDTSAARRKQNPVLVFDVGDVSENTVALGPTALAVNGTDSTFSGRALYGRDSLQSERDPFTRAFNQEKNDTGLPGDVIPRLPFTGTGGSGVALNVPICSRRNSRPTRIGDTRNDCTVNNGRLDEWDLDADGSLNYDSSQRESERIFRYVVDLGDAKSYIRIGGCQASPTDSLGAAGARLCWVKVRVPFNAPLDTVNGGPNIRRVRGFRMTMISGEQLPDDRFSQLPIAKLMLTGARWLKRADRALRGIAGDRTSIGLLSAGSIGTQDKDSLSGLIYDSPPGVIDEALTKVTGLESARTVINEHALRLTASQLNTYDRAEAYYRFPEGARNFMQYRELHVWAKGRGNGWGANGELEFFVKLGRDVNNFYAVRAKAESGPGQATWKDVVVDFDKLYALRARLMNSYLQNRPDSIACTAADSALIARSGVPITQITRRYAACADGYMVYTVDPAVAPPNLQGVQELAVGMVRVDSAAIGATRITPGDTLEVWVDDIRLSRVVNTPGYAGQLGVALEASDLGSLRVNFSHRDANFRQLAEVPTNVAADAIDLSATVRLDRFLPSTGFALPLTVSHTFSTNAPQFLTNSDIRGSGINGLRTPRTAATVVTLNVRRLTPMTDGVLAPVFNNLSFNSTVNAANARSEFQDGRNSGFTAGMDYQIGGETDKRPMGSWWTRAWDVLPSWLSGAELVQAIRDAQFNARPAMFRLSSNYAKGDDARTSFTKPANSFTDSARTVNGLTSFLRNATSLELRPFDALSARWEFSSLRDLRDYGDTSLIASTATAERTTLLGVEAGLERERILTTTYTLQPNLRGWIRPRFDFTTNSGFQRDPNSQQLLRTLDSTGAYALPRRVNALQQLNAGSTFDLGRMLAAFVHDSARLATMARLLKPVDVGYVRTLTSAFDGTPFTPGFNYQLGWGGVESFLREHERLATNAGSNARVSLRGGFNLPFGLSLTGNTSRVATRNWLKRSGSDVSIVDGEQVTLPDLVLSGTWRPAGLDGFITSIGANAQFMATRQRQLVPTGTVNTPDDVRTGRVTSYPFGVSVEWNDVGKLRTAFRMASTFRLDSLPGSVADSKAREMSADVAREFQMPADWQLRSKLRTRLGWQQTAASTYLLNSLAGSARSRLADNGRQAFTLTADTDVAENLKFSLQSSRIVTFDNNLDRRFTQYVLSAILQIAFYAGELR